MRPSSQAAEVLVDTVFAFLAQRGIRLTPTLEQRDRLVTKVERLTLTAILDERLPRSADPARRSKGGTTT
jgi:hypothetical protein